MGQNKLIIVDTDILIDAGRNVNEALNCLQQIEQCLPAAVTRPPKNKEPPLVYLSRLHLPRKKAFSV